MDVEQELERFEFFRGSQDGETPLLPRYSMVHEHPIYRDVVVEGGCELVQVAVEVYHRGEGNVFSLVDRVNL